MHCRRPWSFPIVVALAAGCAAPHPTRAIDWTRATWTPCAPATTNSLRGLGVVDANTIWVGGAGGTLLRSTDGGGSWTNVAPEGSAGCDFRDVEAFDAHCAIAMVAGQPARVYRTVDGGRSWTVVHADRRTAAFFDAIAFSGDRGVLLGDPIDGAFCVWTTADAGRTWMPVPPDQVRANRGEAAFAASGACAAMLTSGDGPRPAVVTGGTTARFLRDEGRGAWSAADLPLPAGAPSRGAFAVAFAPDPFVATRGIVVGGDHERADAGEGSAAYTDDGGRTWHTPAAPPSGYRSGAVWFDHGTVLAVGPRGASVSSDGGRSWQDFGGMGFHAIARGPDGSVFACGSEGRVARLSLAR